MTWMLKAIPVYHKSSSSYALSPLNNSSSIVYIISLGKNDVILNIPTWNKSNLPLRD